MDEAYVEFSEYKSDYKGILIPDKTSFESYAIKASGIINYYTFGRIVSVNSKVIFATCEIAELLYKQDQLKNKIDDDTKTISSETVGPRSISYVNKSSLQNQRILNEKELDKEAYKICLKYLSRTGLMFRGI